MENPQLIQQNYNQIDTFLKNLKFFRSLKGYETNIGNKTVQMSGGKR